MFYIQYRLHLLFIQCAGTNRSHNPADKVNQTRAPLNRSVFAPYPAESKKICDVSICTHPSSHEIVPLSTISVQDSLVVLIIAQF